MNRWLLILGVVGLLVFSIFTDLVYAGTFLTENYNGRTYKVYIPDSYTPGTPVPMLVMLHGCSQTASSFATATKMNNYADSYGFIAVYPQQAISNNLTKCWNWFLPAHQSRNSGEPSEIAGIINTVRTNYTINDQQIVVAGFSAGGAMAAIMGATYPDLIDGIVIHSGLEYKAATSQATAFTVMQNGGPNPNTQGTLAYNAMGSYAHTLPTLVFHGTSDGTVNSINGNQALSQWAQTNDLASDGGIDNNNIDDTPETTIPGTVPGGRTYTEYGYSDSTGQTVMKKYLVNGMGHKWSGGQAGGSYTDPQGPDASLILLQLFLGNGGGGDTTPPITTATPPAGTYPVPQTVTLSSNEPTTIYYALNGGAYAVYTSSIVVNESLSLNYYAVDNAGNSETAHLANYIINPDPPDNQTFTSIATEDGYVGKLIADGKSETVHRLGDKGFYNSDTYRLILSFDTSAIPDGATLTAATLRIYRQSQNNTVSEIKLDIMNGSFGNPSLEMGDYNASASQTNVVTVPPPGSDNSYVDIPLPASALTVLNVTGRTQIRLKPTTPTNYASDTLTLYGGESGSYAPTLTISWQP